MERVELKAYLALHLASGIGSKRLLALYDYFGSAERAIHSRPDEWTKVPGLGDGIAASLSSSREAALQSAEKQLDRLPENTQIITYYDEAYPDALKKIDSPPPLLFVRGNVSLLSEARMIAIVGTRRPSDYGRHVAEEFAAAVTRENVVVVSGFANGIDTQAHKAALESNGKTIAVLGSGIDVIYPSSNKNFAKTLIESGRGAIVSELVLGVGPDGHNFPWRNRIVAGLARATLVVESKKDGGSIITADIARKENRDVFAVPGDIHRPLSDGPNRLIKESSARSALSPEQLLSELGWTKSAATLSTREPIDRTALSMFEAKIVDVLDAAGGPLVIDQIAERAELSLGELYSGLLNLEIKNIVRSLAGKQYMLS